VAGKYWVGFAFLRTGPQTLPISGNRVHMCTCRTDASVSGTPRAWLLMVCRMSHGTTIRD
jgi:hypothetical protein